VIGDERAVGGMSMPPLVPPHEGDAAAARGGPAGPHSTAVGPTRLRFDRVGQRVSAVTPREALAAVPGLPETVLPDDLLDRLPVEVPPPPWSLKVRATVWMQRAAVPLPASSPYAGRALRLAFGAVLDYQDSPVGPYREVFVAVPLPRLGRPAMHVPFIAVDSLPSLQAGRAFWSLPKTLASFSTTGDGRVVAVGDSWSVEVVPRTLPLPVPVAFPVLSAQDGRTAPTTIRGTVRPGLIRVAVRGPTLGGWLGEGTHPGFSARGRIVLGPAED
jgi:Acetoacetate decarboxylase (ADC)